MTPDGNITKLDPLIHWKDLTYYGDMNMGATICSVSFVYLRNSHYYSNNKITKSQIKMAFSQILAINDLVIG